MDKGKIFWHEAHCMAVKLDLLDYLEGLSMTIEHPLTQEALIMDMLIIKKNPDVIITKKFGRIFKTYNIVEYKSEECVFCILTGLSKPTKRPIRRRSR